MLPLTFLCFTQSVSSKGLQLLWFWMARQFCPAPNKLLSAKICFQHGLFSTASRMSCWSVLFCSLQQGGKCLNVLQAKFSTSSWPLFFGTFKTFPRNVMATVRSPGDLRHFGEMLWVEANPCTSQTCNRNVKDVHCFYPSVSLKFQRYAASLEVRVCLACNVLNSLKAPGQSSSARHIKIAKAHVSSKPCTQQPQLQAHGQSPSAMRNSL